MLSMPHPARWRIVVLKQQLGRTEGFVNTYLSIDID
jgi:hypothetical protein